MNIENALRRLVPDPKFFGRLFVPADYDEIVWVDARPKPSWDEIVAADSANMADEADQRAKEAKELADVSAATKYPKLAALRTLSPSEVSAWVDANVNSFADAKDAIKTLAIAVSVLAKRI